MGTMWARINLALNCLAKVRPYVTAFFEGSEKSTGTSIFLIEIICASIAFFAHRLPSGNLHKETHRRSGIDNWCLFDNCFEFQSPLRDVQSKSRRSVFRAARPNRRKVFS